MNLLNTLYVCMLLVWLNQSTRYRIYIVAICLKVPQHMEPQLKEIFLLFNSKYVHCTINDYCDKIVQMVVILPLLFQLHVHQLTFYNKFFFFIFLFSSYDHTWFLFSVQKCAFISLEHGHTKSMPRHCIFFLLFPRLIYCKWILKVLSLPALDSFSYHKAVQ